MVDSVDKERIGISKQELIAMLEVTQVLLENKLWLCKIVFFLKHHCLCILQEDELKKAILVVFANKQVIAFVYNVISVIQYVWIYKIMSIVCWLVIDPHNDQIWLTCQLNW